MPDTWPNLEKIPQFAHYFYTPTMWKIRDAQVKQLELLQWDALQREIIASIRKDYNVSANDYDDHSLETIVRRAVETARSYGLKRRVDLLSFAILAFNYGETFHLHPALFWILSDHTVPSDRKIPFLLSETLPAQWQQIAAAATTDQKGSGL